MPEKILIWIAWHLPKRLVAWCGYRILATATSGKWSSEAVYEVTCAEAMKRWDDD